MAEKKQRSAAQRRADAKYEEKRRGTRHHSWNAIGYPESMPDDWCEILSDQRLQWAASPVHDKDVNASTGEAKKPHRHLVISFHNAQTYEAAKEIFDLVGAVMPPKNGKPGTPKPYVMDLRQELRYFCHLDNPSKAQYDPSEVVVGGGLDYWALASTAAEDEETICVIQDFCDQYQVTSYRRLCQYVRKYRPEWRRIVLKTGAVALSRYLKSTAWEREHPNLSGDILYEIAPDMVTVENVDDEALAAKWEEFSRWIEEKSSE